MNTYDYYQTYAKEFFSHTVNLDMQAVYKEFLKHIPDSGRILDAGCGSGRDSLYFLENGYDVIAFDFSEEMVKLASTHIKQPVLHMPFEKIDFREEFHGVWASASLLHIPKGKLHVVLSNLALSLMDQGVLYCSFKYGDKEEIRTGRYFNNYTEKGIPLVLQKVPILKLVKLWRLADNRPERKGEYWLNVLLKKR